MFKTPHSYLVPNKTSTTIYVTSWNKQQVKSFDSLVMTSQTLQTWLY